MSNPAGYTGVFRYSDQHPQAVQPWWDPEYDVADVAADLHDLIEDELVNPQAVEWIARSIVSCPDVRVSAAVLQLPVPAWATPDNPQPAWILTWEDDAELNVVEHPDRDSAVQAFWAHLTACENAGNRYDFVINPRAPQTAVPPGHVTERP